MQTAYGSARLGATVPDCDKAAKPLKVVMIVLLVLTVILTLLLVAIVLFNRYKIIDSSKTKGEQNKAIALKKKYVNTGMYASIGMSLLTMGASFYAFLLANKMISCPAQ